MARKREDDSGKSVNRAARGERPQRARGRTLDIQIRLASPAEAGRVAEVLLEGFREFKALYTEGGFRGTTPSAQQILDRFHEGPVWVAVQNGSIVGTVAAVKKGDSAYIRSMAVLPASRGSGGGSRLLEQLERWAAAEGLGRLFLSTTPFLDSAIRLYERFGFRRTSDEPHDLFGTPLFTMEKIPQG